jgi:Helix-turn-helix domain
MSKHWVSRQQCTTGDTYQPAVVKQGTLKLIAACEYLGGISVTSLRRLIKRGLVRPNRSLRHILIPIGELDRFLREGEQ